MSDAPSSDNVRNTVAVRLPTNASHTEKLGEYLTSLGWTEARRFLPKDDDELNDRLCRGEFGVVVFAEIDDVLRMIWSGHGSVRRWRFDGAARTVDIHFADDKSMGADQSAWHGFLSDIERSHSAWDTERRRKQTIAGCILTAVALAAMGLLLWTRG